MKNVFEEFCTVGGGVPAYWTIKMLFKQPIMYFHLFNRYNKKNIPSDNELMTRTYAQAAQVDNQRPVIEA